MKDWKGSVAFITGGGQGIGLGIARALAKRDVKLALADVDEAALARSRQELAPLTAVETYVLDVRDRERFAKVADDVAAKLGPVDLLFNNAGIAPDASLKKLDYDRWDLVLGINVMGVVNGLQTFLPGMMERESGYIVNTASGAGLVGGANVLYTSSKFAIVGLSESLKLEASKYGIDVSVLCPAQVDTQILQSTKKIFGDVPVWERDEPLEKTAASLRSGKSIDEVGEIVIAGMEAGAAWIHTSDLLRPYVKMRADMILESMPQPAVGEPA